jgi:hypothetical protein
MCDPKDGDVMINDASKHRVKSKNVELRVKIGFLAGGPVRPESGAALVLFVLTRFQPRSFSTSPGIFVAEIG